MASTIYLAVRNSALAYTACLCFVFDYITVHQLVQNALGY